MSRLNLTFHIGAPLNKEAFVKLLADKYNTLWAKDSFAVMLAYQKNSGLRDPDKRSITIFYEKKTFLRLNQSQGSSNQDLEKIVKSSQIDLAQFFSKRLMEVKRNLLDEYQQVLDQITIETKINEPFSIAIK